MKTLIVLIITTFSFGVWADEPMTEPELAVYLDRVEIDIRKSYWRRGFENVESRTYRMQKVDIDNYVKRENSRRYHENLDTNEVADIYRCHYSDVCVVILVRVTNSYHSGWGEYSHFLLIHTTERRHEEISHLVYGE